MNASAVTVLAVLACGAGAVAGCGATEDTNASAANLPGPAAEDVVLTADGVDPEAVRRANADRHQSKARVVELRGAGQPTTYSNDDGVSPGAPSDDEVRAELREGRIKLARFKQFLGTTAYAITGPRAKVLPNGTAVAPANAPESVKQSSRPATRSPACPTSGAAATAPGATTATTARVRCPSPWPVRGSWTARVPPAGS